MHPAATVFTALARRAFTTLGCAAALALLCLGCGGSPRPSGPVLLLDVKVQQPEEMPTILGATLRFDGREIARFAQERPESMVLFSKRLEGIAPGEHGIELSIDAHTVSPTRYQAKGVVNYDGRQLPLDEVVATLETGQAIRFALRL